MRRTLRGSRLFRRKESFFYFTGAAHKALIGMLILPGVLVLLAIATAQAPHALADAPQLQIVVPAPSSGGVSQGPVGANVSITGQIPAAPGDSYQIGWAPQSGTCTANFTPTTLAPVTSDGSGNLSATFSWPSNANTIGASYYVCALDATNPGNGYFQSAQLFQVAASSKPSITVSGQSSTGTKGIFAGGTLQISGSQFLPGGTKLYVFLNGNQGFAASDLQPNQALPTTDGSDINSADDGGFSATVKVPDDANGSMYLHVVSSDGTQDFPPALVATKQITIAQAPTPTPNPTVTATTTANNGGTGNQSGTNGALPAIIGLGALSIVLFIVGVILIATVASSPGAGDNRTGSGTRY